MRTIIVIVFIIACAYVGINMIKGFADTVLIPDLMGLF